MIALDSTTKLRGGEGGKNRGRSKSLIGLTKREGKTLRGKSKGKGEKP